MIKVCAIMLFIVMLLFSAGCGRNIDIDRRLDQADGLMWGDPDSALRVLDAIDPEQLSDGQQARRALLAAKAADKAFASISDPASIAIAADYYTGHADSLEVQSLYYLGQAYSLSESTDTALVMLHEAFDKAQAIDDYFYAAMSAREIAAIYGRMLVPGQQLIWARKARSGFDEAGKSTHAAWMDLMIINALINSGNLQEADSIFNTIDTTLVQSSRPLRHKLMTARVEMLVSGHDYEDVSSIYDSLYADGYVMTSHDYCLLAEADIEAWRVDSLPYYLSYIRSLPLSNEDTLYVRKLNGSYLELVGDYRGASRAYSDFASSVMNYGEDLITDPPTVMLAETLRVAMTQEKAISRQHRKLQILLMALCGTLLLLIILGWLYWRNRIARLTLKVKSALSDAQLFKYELDSTHSEQEQSQHQKNAFIDIFTSHLSFIEQICQICYFREEGGSYGPTAIRQLNDMYESMKVLDIHDSLGAFIDCKFDGWMTRFKRAYPDLKSSQYRLAMYLLLNISYESIAVLTGKKTPNAVYIDKTRLKTAMLQTNGHTEDEFIIALKMSKTSK